MLYSIKKYVLQHKAGAHHCAPARINHQNNTHYINERVCGFLGNNVPGLGISAADVLASKFIGNIVDNDYELLNAV